MYRKASEASCAGQPAAPHSIRAARAAQAAQAAHGDFKRAEQCGIAPKQTAVTMAVGRGTADGMRCTKRSPAGPTVEATPPKCACTHQKSSAGRPDAVSHEKKKKVCQWPVARDSLAWGAVGAERKKSVIGAPLFFLSPFLWPNLGVAGRRCATSVCERKSQAQREEAGVNLKMILDCAQARLGRQRSAEHRSAAAQRSVQLSLDQHPPPPLVLLSASSHFQRTNLSLSPLSYRLGRHPPRHPRLHLYARLTPTPTLESLGLLFSSASASPRLVSSRLVSPCCRAVFRSVQQRRPSPHRIITASTRPHHCDPSVPDHFVPLAAAAAAASTPLAPSCSEIRILLCITAPASSWENARFHLLAASPLARAPRSTATKLASSSIPTHPMCAAC